MQGVRDRKETYLLSTWPVFWFDSLYSCVADVDMWFLHSYKELNPATSLWLPILPCHLTVPFVVIDCDCNSLFGWSNMVHITTRMPSYWWYRSQAFICSYEPRLVLMYIKLGVVLQVINKKISKDEKWVLKDWWSCYRSSSFLDVLNSLLWFLLLLSRLFFKFWLSL